MQLWADLRDSRRTVPGRTRRRTGVLPAPPRRPRPPYPRAAGGRAALYRDRLAGKRALVVLDDAADEDQVRHLLPGSSSCLLLITSRRVLSGLDGAHTIRLGTFAPEEAVALIERVAGPGRYGTGDRHGTRHEADTGHEADTRRGPTPVTIPTRCPADRRTQRLSAAGGGAGRAQTAFATGLVPGRPGGTAGERRGRLRQFAVGTRAVNAAFDLSYRSLPRRQRQAFRLLSLHPGDDCTPDSAAALLDTSRAEAEDLLEALLDEHLMQQHTLGRYRYHDLLRLFARERVHDEDDEEQLTEACAASCTGTAPLARPPATASNPGGHRTRRGTPPRATTRCLADSGSAMRWLERERANLLAVSDEAARRGWHEWTWRLAVAAHSCSGCTRTEPTASRACAWAWRRPPRGRPAVAGTRHARTGPGVRRTRPPPGSGGTPPPRPGPVRGGRRPARRGRGAVRTRPDLLGARPVPGERPVLRPGPADVPADRRPARRGLRARGPRPDELVHPRPLPGVGGQAPRGARVVRGDRGQPGRPPNSAIWGWRTGSSATTSTAPVTTAVP
ncbi:hypothetical protein NKH77_02210 [Streptomyces sp. M19]